MNKNKQKALNKVSEILNTRKHVFGKNIEYIEIESNFVNYSINGHSVKAEIDIWKKIEDKEGLIRSGKFYVYDGETYEQSVNEYLENYQ